MKRTRPGVMERLSACSKALEVAPFHPQGWMAAVDLFTEAAEARGGQFIGRAAPGLESFHLASSDLLAAQNAWIAHGGLDPEISPMVSKGLSAPVLVPYTDGDAISQDDRRRNHLWRSVHERWDIPHITCTVLWRKNGDQIVLAALRSAKQGSFGSEDIRRQSMLMPHWYAAIKLSATLKENARPVLLGALEAVQADVFLLNGFGRVVAATPGAERLTAPDGWFRLRHGRLSARTDANASTLEAAILKGMRGAAPVSVELVDASGFLDVQVARLPPEACDIGFGAAVLVIAENHLNVPKLTPAEREIARDLLRALPLSAIADQRGTSIQTVRGQAKSIYAKAQVEGQLGLIQRFSPQHR